MVGRSHQLEQGWVHRQRAALHDWDKRLPTTCWSDNVNRACPQLQARQAEIMTSHEQNLIVCIRTMKDSTQKMAADRYESTFS